MGPPWLTLAAGEGVVRHSFWLPSGSGAVAAWLHVPGSGLATGAVVVCSPIGYEYTHSYRSLLHMADALAARGLATIRFDYSGTGAAEGDAFSADLLTRWLADIEHAASFVRGVAGTARCDLVGVQLGATLAAVASSRFPVDELVLWAPVVHGRSFVRERRLLARVATEGADGRQTYLDAGGFVLAKQTADHLAALDMTRLDYSSMASRVLIVERDDVATAPLLVGAIQAKRVPVDVRSPGGYLDMVAEPQYARVPEEAIQVIAAWLERDAGATRKKIKSPVADAGPVTSWPVNGATEELVLIPGEAPLFGVLTKPAAPRALGAPLVILANAGSVHQVGPNRTYVRLTRAMAERGIPSLRFDLRNLGDSITRDSPQENHPYPEAATRDLTAAVRWVQTLGHPTVVLGGLCSGAHAAFRAALTMDDPVPQGLLMINPLTFRWSEGMSLDTPDSHRLAGDAGYYRSAMGNLANWRRLLTGKTDVGRLASFVARRSLDLVGQTIAPALRALRLKSPTGLELELNALEERGVGLDFVFSDSDPGKDILYHEARGAVKRMRRLGLLTLSTIRHADHTFSKLPARLEFTERAVGALVEREASPWAGHARTDTPPVRRVLAGLLHEVVPYRPDSWSGVAPAWRELFRSTDETSPFLSTEWMETWVETFGALMRPEVHIWREPGGRTVGSALVSQRAVRIGPFTILRAYLNATGEGAVFSEHNDILVFPEHRDAVTRDLVSKVRARGVDQLALAGFREQGAHAVRGTWPTDGGVDERWSEDRYVDLDRLRAGGSDYLSSLSPNTRSQIKRSTRLYTTRFGAPGLQIASDATEAATWLSQLVHLHNDRWHARGLVGGFAAPGVTAFHAALIERAFRPASDLRVDVLRLSFGAEPIGFLYNLRCGRYVASYQSGLRYDSDNRLKPGLVIHATVIDHYRETGSSEYDFLAGEPEAVQYKRSLAMSSRRLLWGELSEVTLRMTSISMLRRARRRLRPLVSGPSSSEQA